jgi:hemerythrin superfamily protein
MDALEILKQDHQKVKNLFREITQADQGAREDIFDQIGTELEIHAHIEETIFYPALQQHEELNSMVIEALEEHEEVKALIEEIEDAGADSHDSGAKIQELMDAVEHHVAEEEGNMFSKAREIFSETELAELGKRLASAKAGEKHEIA